MSVRILWAFFFAGVAVAVQAASFVTEWDPVPGASSYEYQISRTPKFGDPKNFVTQGTTRESRLEESLKPGMYFVRVRAYDKGRQPGRWSPPFQIQVTGASFRILEPPQNKLIEKNGDDAPILIRWEPVSDVDDYELVVSQKGKILRSTVSETNQLAVSDLGTGDYVLQVFARSRGLRVGQSGEWPLQVKTLPAEDLRIYTREGRLPKYQEFEKFTIAWKRGLPGDTCDLEVSRMGKNPGIVFRERIIKKLEYEVPGLPRGTYQALVRCFDPTLSVSRDSIISIEIFDNPMDMHSRESGVTARFFSFGFPMGRRQMTNRYLDRISDKAISGGMTLFEGRGEWRVTERFKLEGILESEMAHMVFSSSGGSESSDHAFWLDQANGPITGRMRFNAGYTYPWGSRNFFTPKAGLLYWYLRNYVQFNDEFQKDDQGNSTGKALFRLSNYSLGALTLGGDWRFRIKPSWDLLSEVLMDVPIAVEHGVMLGRGSAIPVPSFTVSSFLRKRISDEFRLGFGLEWDWQTASVHEVENGEAKPTTKDATNAIAPRLFIEWDL